MQNTYLKKLPSVLLGGFVKFDSLPDSRVSFIHASQLEWQRYWIFRTKQVNLMWHLYEGEGSNTKWSKRMGQWDELWKSETSQGTPRLLNQKPKKEKRWQIKDGIEKYSTKALSLHHLLSEERLHMQLLPKWGLSRT